MKPSLRESLLSSSHDELVKLYKSLPAADINVLQGEVDGQILAGKNSWGNVLSWLSTHSPYPGIWKGKGYQAVNQTTGRGYNRFNFFGIEHRSMRFETRADVSRLDNRPVMMMDYKPYMNPLGLLRALDEVRQIDEHNYLLCGYWSWPLFGPSQVLFYHVYGPVGPFND